MLIKRLPMQPLRPFVALMWASDNLAPQRFARTVIEHVLPTGAMHLVFRLTDGPLRIFESHDDPTGQALGEAIVGGVRSRFYIRELSAPSCSVGAVLQPGAAKLLLGVGADELSERHTPLQDLWGVSARSLRERLLETPSAEERLALLESVLASRLPHVRLMHPAIAAVVNEMHTVQSVDAAVKRSGISHRQFIHLFRRAFGLAPKSYLRIARFQNALQSFKHGNTVSLARVAADAGHSDQSHFNRDFLEFSGVTPATYEQLSPFELNHLPINRA